MAKVSGSRCVCTCAASPVAGESIAHWLIDGMVSDCFGPASPENTIVATVTTCRHL